MSLLRILGCDVFPAENGAVAVELFADVIERPNSAVCPFDIVLMVWTQANAHPQL